MDGPSTSGGPVDWKSEGNREFKAGNYLKAGALYSRGIKADPTNAVLYSNRSACLLKLLKMQKALSDAEECIRLKADWEKGYFRKAAVLEALERYVEALAAYKKAAELNPENKEVTDKIRTLNKLTRKATTSAAKQASSPDPKHKANGMQHASGSARQSASTSKVKELPAPSRDDSSGGREGAPAAAARPATVRGTMVAQDGYQKAKDNLSKGDPVALTEERVLDFGMGLLDQVVQNVSAGKTDVVPCVHFLPGQLSADGSEQHGEVSIREAFVTPETLSQCITFLRQYGEDTNAHAACVVVSKQDIQYPPVWKFDGFPKNSKNGIFVQLDSVKVRRLWFVPHNGKGNVPREPVELNLEYKLVEPLLR